MLGSEKRKAILIDWLFVGIVSIFLLCSPAYSEEMNSAAEAHSPRCDHLLKEILSKLLSDRNKVFGSDELWQQMNVLVQRHPELESSGLISALEWFTKHGGLDDAVWRIHLSDWLRGLKIDDLTSLAALRNAWPKLTIGQRSKAAKSFADKIDAHALSNIFDDPDKWREHIDLTAKLGLSTDEVQEFNVRWKRMTPEERELFLIVSLSQELPSILEYFEPLMQKNGAMIPVSQAAQERVPVKISTGTFTSRKLMIQKEFLVGFKRMPTETFNAWIVRTDAVRKNAFKITFDDIDYYLSQVTKEDLDRPAFEYKFKGVSSDEIKKLGGFRMYNEEATISAVTKRLILMIDKTDRRPTPSEIEIMFKKVPHMRDQSELIFVIDHKFPD